MLVSQVLRSLFVLAAAWILRFSYRFYKNRRWFKDLPKPPHSFLWGHLKLMGEIAATLPPNVHPQHMATAIAKMYNLSGIFYLDMWPIADSMIILTDPDLMSKVAVNMALPIHPLAEEVLRPIVGKNVIAGVNGALWKKSHKAMAPAFSWSHVRNMSPVMVDECLTFQKTLDRYADSGEVFSMVNEGGKLIFDVIARLVFNFSLHAQTEGSQDLEDLKAMVGLAEAALSWDPILKLKTFLPRRRIFNRLQISIGGKIRERLALLREGKIVPSRKDPHSILDLMLREHVEEHAAGKDTNEVKLPKAYTEMVTTNLKGLLVGGHSTTNDTLCYALMLLSKSPSAITKLRAEHDLVFSPSPSETLSILSDNPSKLDELEYTTAVIRETLRLFPIGFTVRQAPAGAKLEYKGAHLPLHQPGTRLTISPNPQGLHYDPAYFPDPSSFNPDRFTDPQTAQAARANMRTFGRGARACLGQNLALDELRVVLLMVGRGWEFECVGLQGRGEGKGRMEWLSELEMVFGDVVFQELGLSAGVRGEMGMRVRKVDRET
ncbi:cytochrome P450 [Amylocarpus encephaloides]|uniref:Cytochrome P450 n=1 Tax=Amylocarpus encephaloides TaxID=45428 RepID=A0A9P7YCV5_9HELO|nr:cytochrome P450 [Amylocarpus encephaloides]